MWQPWQLAGRRPVRALLGRVVAPLAVGVAQPLEVLALRRAQHVGAEQAHVVARAAEAARREIGSRRGVRRAVHARYARAAAAAQGSSQ